VQNAGSRCVGRCPAFPRTVEGHAAEGMSEGALRWVPSAPMKGASPWVRGGADAAAPSSHRVPSASTQACARESSRHVRARDRGASHKVDSRTRLGACGNGICGRGRCPCPNSAMLMPRLNLGTRFPKSLADRHAGASRAPSISFDSCGPFGGRQYVQLSAWFDMMSSKVSGGSLRRSWTRRAVLKV
jgi:hypothetical protein